MGSGPFQLCPPPAESASQGLRRSQGPGTKGPGTGFLLHILVRRRKSTQEGAIVCGAGGRSLSGGRGQSPCSPDSQPLPTLLPSCWAWSCDWCGATHTGGAGLGPALPLTGRDLRASVSSPAESDPCPSGPSSGSSESKQDQVRNGTQRTEHEFGSHRPQDVRPLRGHFTHGDVGARLTPHCDLLVLLAGVSPLSLLCTFEALNGRLFIYSGPQAAGRRKSSGAGVPGGTLSTGASSLARLDLQQRSWGSEAQALLLLL